MNSCKFDFKLSEVCRLCLIQEGDMIHIFENKNSAAPLSTKIMTCVSIEVEADDGLPNVICQGCVSHIDSWYKFKNQCQSTDAILREYLVKEDMVNGKHEETNCLDTNNTDSSQKRKIVPRRRTKYSLMQSKGVSSTTIKQDEKAESLVNSSVALGVEDVSIYPYLPTDVKLEVKCEPEQEDSQLKQSVAQEEENSNLNSALPIMKSFSCNVCEKSFSSKYYLRDHKSVHSGEQDFICSDCGKTFYRKHKLIVHLKTHSAERPFLCSMCGKAYRKNSDLKKHFSMHSAESRFLCNVCGKTYKTKFSLTHHLLIHSNEKKYMCAECGKAFTHPETLRAHTKVHTQERPIICKVCKKGFKRKEHLIRHTRIHTVEKPFLCPHCSRCFTGKWNLTQHIRLHTGQKPYVCCVCDEAFTHNVTLRNHVKNHHPEYQKPD